MLVLTVLNDVDALAVTEWHVVYQHLLFLLCVDDGRQLGDVLVTVDDESSTKPGQGPAAVQAALAPHRERMTLLSPV